MSASIRAASSEGRGSGPLCRTVSREHGPGRPASPLRRRLPGGVHDAPGHDRLSASRLALELLELDGEAQAARMVGIESLVDAALVRVELQRRQVEREPRFERQPATHSQDLGVRHATGAGGIFAEHQHAAAEIDHLTQDGGLGAVVVADEADHEGSSSTTLWGP